MNPIAEEIIKLRKRLNLSQDDLAKALGLAQAVVVYRWEVGDRLPSGPIRRLFYILNELSKTEAQKLLQKFESYNEREGR